MRRSRLTFLVGSVIDVLLSQTNLCRMGRVDDPVCRVCGICSESLDYVLAGCQTALSDGRYRFRHNLVLETLEQCVRNQSVFANGNPSRVRGSNSISFVRAGASCKTRSDKAVCSALAGATDWEFRVDCGTPQIFPEHIVATTLCPDIVIWSNKLKHVILGELTVPLERCVLDAHERKCKKYEDLVLECETAGWKVDFYAIEVGCRGFPTSSLNRFVRCLGLSRKAGSDAVKLICNRAEAASFWIWCRRGDVTWDPGPFRPQIHSVQ